jgi:3-hexulose-6-phosphate synthase/6-phospho-3-hexuloisomerase
MPAELQVALDFVTLDRALQVASEAVRGGADRLEAGTPLIKSEGLDAVRRLREQFPDKIIVADMKIMDAGTVEVEIAAKAGADVVAVLGAASDSTIGECVRAARRYDAQIMVDLLGVPDPLERAGELAALGVDLLNVHCPIDEQMRGETPFATLEEVARAASCPVAVAGGINSETAAAAAQAGASVVIVGGAICKAPDAQAATEQIKRALETGAAIETELFKRVGETELRDLLARISTANLSDAMHRQPVLPGIKPLARGTKCVGVALTVWTYPGDWAKPVEAIDEAEPGEVIVIDAGGGPPALWGDQASTSALMKGLAGTVIYGAARDTGDIIEMGYPVFCSDYCSNAGDPHGQGTIGVPLAIGGIPVHTGDWLVGDDDGVIVIPKDRAVEVANRAQAVIEREGRELEEIDRGSTLGQVSELMRWEQRRRQRRPKPQKDE